MTRHDAPLTQATKETRPNETPSSSFSTCTLPLRSQRPERILLAHGGGGTLMHALIEEELAPLYQNPAQCQRDSALLGFSSEGGRLVLSTDSFVVEPLFFPGGDIGKLAVCGTCNDLAMSGAIPKAITLSLILSEGFPLAELRRILQSFRATLDEAGVELVAGDTKVVALPGESQIYLNTTGIGLTSEEWLPGPDRIRPGDLILVSGDLGRHAVSLMSARQGSASSLGILSDCALLQGLVLFLRDEGLPIRCLRDLTRGGFFTAVLEIAEAAGLSARLHEPSLPVHPAVASYCDVMGYQPGFLANEGRLLCVTPASEAEATLEALRKWDPAAAILGEFSEGRAGQVSLENAYGVSRVLQREYGELLPRIC